jgi:hypothetical protein
MKKHIKCSIFFATLIFSVGAFCQNVYVAGGVKSQPLVYRDSSGNFYGCGIRTVFLTDVPKPTHIGDISVNIFKQKSGDVVGLAKIIYSRIDNMKDMNSTKNLPLYGFMFAESSGKAMKFGEMKAGDDKNSYLAQTSVVDAIQYLTDVTGGKTTQVGVVFKGGDDSMRIFSVKGQPFTQEEVTPLAACIKQISPK